MTNVNNKQRTLSIKSHKVLNISWEDFNVLIVIEEELKP